MNKKFIRVLGLGVGLFLAGSLSVNAQKVSFNGERLSLKQAFEKLNLFRSIRLLITLHNWMSISKLS